ncbi:MAG: DUF2459 domain-containing protein [Calditrichaceae bacterium]|nr:DUF2459 domain-containing protein [Calditrichaceae bacterium]MBN2709616.1 DUF2459 domain-containing protein [Calditrichaceae bacterium]RQV92413.1 MAG: DUF2459 domain-containing protein [Calditrichota bacterium]
MRLAFLLSIIFIVHSDLIYSQNVFNLTEYGQISEDSTYSVYVVSHGWHTGVVLARNDFIPSMGTDSIFFPQGRWLEFGWGDKDFYMSTPSEEDVNWLTTVKAAIWPTASVIHVVGFDKPVPEYFSVSDLIGFNITDSLRREIVKFIIKSFAKNDDGKIDSLSKGLYGESRFFTGREKYYFPKTCNVWTARALVEGGIRLKPYYCQKASTLMDNLEKEGTVIRRIDKNR